MKPETIEQLFGTLVECSAATWKKHLKTSNRVKHEDLNDFYNDMPELVDTLIEAYQGLFGKVDKYENLLADASDMTALEYLEALHDICKSGRDLLQGETELESDMDAVLDLISSTMYKIREMDEKHPQPNESLSDYIGRVLED